MSRIQLEPAYILHSRAFRETSLIVEALTREHGRIAVVARGVKSPRSRWRLTRAATCWMRSIEPTEVPPYFWTISAMSLQQPDFDKPGAMMRARQKSAI